MNSERIDERCARGTESFMEQFLPHRAAQANAHGNARQPLRVIKFGGTSLKDAACILKAIEIIRRSSTEGDVVVVVSAMGGVTNKLIYAATRSAAGDRSQASTILDELRRQHYTVANVLIHSGVERDRIGSKMRSL